MTRHLILSSIAVLAVACDAAPANNAASADPAQTLESFGGKRSPSKGEGRPRRGPPPAALEACAEANEDAACSFQGRRGKVSGRCASRRGGDGLVCQPERGEAPREAINACASANAGATCRYETPRGEISGTCVSQRNGDGLLCRAQRRGPPRASINACSHADEGGDCSFEGTSGQVTGTCQRQGASLLCRPQAHPPEEQPQPTAATPPTP